MPKCDFNKVAFAISVKLLCNFIEIALRHGCPPINLLHIFKTLFPRNTSGGIFPMFDKINERCVDSYSFRKISQYFC